MTVRIISSVIPKKELNLDEYAVVDLETTGVRTYSDDIIEIAVLVVKHGEPAGEFSSLVRLERMPYVPYSVTELTGISTRMAMLEGRPLGAAMEQFLNVTRGLPLVAHNAPFDYRFLQDAWKRCNDRRVMWGNSGLPDLDNCVFDTLAMARKLYKHTSCSLAALTEMMNIDSSGAHRALKDCYMAHEVLQRMMRHPEWEKWFSQRAGWLKKTIRHKQSGMEQGGK